MFFGVTWSNNDINALNDSGVFKDVLDGRVSNVRFATNEVDMK